MPEVSVIVPVYKIERYLRRCIDSILTQTFTDFELILVDDGSPDNSGAICDEYAQKDSRVSVIHKENGGVSSARNAGLDVARGEYIAFCDSDDTVTDHYLEELMQWREYDYVTAGFSWQDPQGNWHVRKFEDFAATVDNIRSLPSKYMGKYYFGSPWATLMRRSLIEANAIRFEITIHSGEDTLFIFEYLEYANSVKIVPVCGYYYHYYPMSLARKPHKDLWKWRIAVERAVLAFFDGASKAEKAFLINREFEVLKNLISIYNRTEVINRIYIDPFFASCIAYKADNGNIHERLFIYAMRKEYYGLYKMLDNILAILERVKCKLKNICDR